MFSKRNCGAEANYFNVIADKILLCGQITFKEILHHGVCTYEYKQFNVIMTKIRMLIRKQCRR